jgi:cell division control protein 6
LKENEGIHYKINISKIYDDFLSSPKIFKNRDALNPTYIPDNLLHRDSQIIRIAEITAPALKDGVPFNFLCFGKTGTGKTSIIRFVERKLREKCEERKIKKTFWVYNNCHQVNTPYRILANIFNTISVEEKIPPTGLPKDIIFKRLLDLLDDVVGDSVCFIVLDEIDILIKKKGGNEILYDLTRLNEKDKLEKCRICIIGISNVLKFKSYLDPRVLSSFGGEELVFPAYNAEELTDILIERAKISFYDGVIKEGTIPLCAAIAAKEHGDARKALQLLRKAGELAERKNNKKISPKFVYEAQEDLERDNIEEYIMSLPKQIQLILCSILLIVKTNPDLKLRTGDIYDVYTDISNKIPGVKKLTQRRVSDLINELALAEIVKAEVISMGYYGRSKIVKLDIPLVQLYKILEKIDTIKELLKYTPVIGQKGKAKLNKITFKKLF